MTPCSSYDSALSEMSVRFCDGQCAMTPFPRNVLYLPLGSLTAVPRVESVFWNTRRHGPDGCAPTAPAKMQNASSHLMRAAPVSFARCPHDARYQLVESYPPAPEVAVVAAAVPSGAPAPATA